MMYKLCAFFFAHNRIPSDLYPKTHNEVYNNQAVLVWGISVPYCFPRLVITNSIRLHFEQTMNFAWILTYLDSFVMVVRTDLSDRMSVVASGGIDEIPVFSAAFIKPCFCQFWRPSIHISSTAIRILPASIIPKFLKVFVALLMIATLVNWVILRDFALDHEDGPVRVCGSHSIFLVWTYPQPDERH